MISRRDVSDDESTLSQRAYYRTIYAQSDPTEIRIRLAVKMTLPLSSATRCVTNELSLNLVPDAEAEQPAKNTVSATIPAKWLIFIVVR